MRLSIIIPVLNESEQILETLLPLQAMRQRNTEVILVDGGSYDDTCVIAQANVDKIIISLPGRAKQMNAGAEQATGSVYWFLHADTVAPENSDQLIQKILNNFNDVWGRFDVRFSSQGFIFSTIATMMNLRSRLTGIATGDQGLFISKEMFEKVGRYAAIPLMEDIEISTRLRKIHRPLIIANKLITSSRRWQNKGVLKTIFLMWALRFFFFLGVSPAQLHRWYES